MSRGRVSVPFQRFERLAEIKPPALPGESYLRMAARAGALGSDPGGRRARLPGKERRFRSAAKCVGGVTVLDKSGI